VSARELTLTSAHVRLGALFGGVFLISGVWQPFLPVWLGVKGFSVDEIGIVLATTRGLQVISLPIVAFLAARGGRLVDQLLIACVVATSVFLVLPFFARGLPLAGLLGLWFLGMSASMPSLELFVFSLPPIKGARIEFGPVRKWGSLGFVSGSLLAGAVLNVTGILGLPALLACTGAAAVVCCLIAMPLDRGAKPAAAASEAGTRGSLSLSVLAVMGVEVLVQGSHVQLNTLATVHWSGEGHSNLFIGWASAIPVLAETISFGVIWRFFRGGGGRRLLVLGGTAAALRWVVMASDPSGPVILALQALHGFTFAGTHVGAMELVAELSPRANRAMAQGVMIAVTSGVNAALTASSGALDNWFGQGAYWVMAAIALVGLALVPAIQPLKVLEPKTQS
jgi:PPP family 3-phenylpropionic acid transporter